LSYEHQTWQTCGRTSACTDPEVKCQGHAISRCAAGIGMHNILI